MLRYHSSIKMKPNECMANPDKWPEARMNMLKKGYSNRKTKKFAASFFDYEENDRVLLNTNLDERSNFANPIKPVWGALGKIVKRRSSYTYLVWVTSAKLNKHNMKKVSVEKLAVIHVR